MRRPRLTRPTSTSCTRSCRRRPCRPRRRPV
jgi:hypothetical protein